MRADIIEKSNIIKKLDKDLKEKEKLPSKKDFDKLNSNHEKVSNELEDKIRTIKNKDEEIKNLRNKLENLVEHNKNLKNKHYYTTLIQKKGEDLVKEREKFIKKK